MLRKRFYVLLFSVLAGGALADGNTPVIGDATAGKTLYEGKCLSCHGIAGASAVPTQPILAAQHAEYTAMQLRYFQTNARKNAVMSAMSTDLSEADIADLSQYLAEQKPVIAGATDLPLAQNGEKLYRGGVIADGIPACAACHGQTGAGVPFTYPRLSGQHAEYVASSLREYASGTRPAAVMNDIATKLSEEQINALAAYISGLAP